MLLPCDALIPLARTSATVRAVSGAYGESRHTAEVGSPVSSMPMLDEDASFLHGRIVIIRICALSAVSNLTLFLSLLSTLLDLVLALRICQAIRGPMGWGALEEHTGFSE